MKGPRDRRMVLRFVVGDGLDGWMVDTPYRVFFVVGEEKDRTSGKKWLTHKKKVDSSRINRTAPRVLQKLP
jgi:hypothetical protein